jgi:DNA topoisomerase IA
VAIAYLTLTETSGITANTLISRLFPDLVNASFTANMEAYLDKIAHGEGDKVSPGCTDDNSITEDSSVL